MGRPGKCRMLKMAIADIIVEVDAYLERLHHARTLLLAPLTQSRSKHTQPETPKTKLETSAPSVSEKTSVLPTKSKVRRSSSQMSLALNAPAIQSSIVLPEAPVPPEAMAEATAPAAVEKIVLPASGRKRTAIRPARPRPAAVTPSPKAGQPRPAIALSGSVSSRIVVVPAQQAKKEREDAAHVEVKRPRVSIAGLSGRRAFDALFNDDQTSSDSSEK